MSERYLTRVERQDIRLERTMRLYCALEILFGSLLVRRLGSTAGSAGAGGSNRHATLDGQTRRNHSGNHGHDGGADLEGRLRGRLD